MADAGNPVGGNVAVLDANGNVVDGGAPPSGGGGAGSNTIVSGLAYPYDPTPASPNPEDDEFNSAVLNPKWSLTSTAAAADVNTTWRSHVYCLLTDGGHYHRLEQSYAPAGDFSITARAQFAADTNYQGFHLYAYATDGQNAVRLVWEWQSGHCATVSTLNNGTWSYDNAMLDLKRFNAGLLHLQRSGNDWIGWCSYDGIAWYYIGQVTKTLTVGKVRLELTNGGAARPLRAGIDWLRRNWLTFP